MVYALLLHLSSFRILKLGVNLLVLVFQIL